MYGGDGLDADGEEPLVVVHPLHVGQLNLRVQHEVVRRGLLHRHRQTTLPGRKLSVPQQRQPRVPGRARQVLTRSYPLRSYASGMLNDKKKANT